MIKLSYGGFFDEQHLVQHIRKSGRNYIIQGQTACTRANHPKPDSLDYWLRQFADNPDTKQADNNVIAQLVATGLFQKKNNLRCPNSSRLCKGLVLIQLFISGGNSRSKVSKNNDAN